MNIGPSSRYMFLFDKPITYTRPLIFGERRITDVKLLVIGYNKMCTHSSVWLYKANEKVDWNGILTKEADYMNLIYDDNFFIENTKLDWLLGRFGLE